MTEVERIYQEGWLCKDFWEEAVICNYKISSHMKKVWAVELDLRHNFSWKKLSSNTPVFWYR